MNDSSYYVYVYIDPRDYSEFYYGKGKGNRKDAHLTDSSDSEKTRVIREIKAEGLEPIIKVVAKDLTEQEAYLVEKTLIWKLGRTLTNVSSGKFRERFRPHKTLHLDLLDFDFQRGLYFFNIGDVSAPDYRDWEDMRRYNFITAGHGRAYSDPLETFQVGDLFCAYRSRSGYVGIGRILSKAVPYRRFRIRGRLLSQFDVAGDYGHDSHNPDQCEWICGVSWIKSVPASKAKWESNSGLFSKQMIKASLQDQPRTIHFLEDAFGVKFERLLKQSGRVRPLLRRQR
jgi:hypothetical protein